MTPLVEQGQEKCDHLRGWVVLITALYPQTGLFDIWLQIQENERAWKSGQVRTMHTFILSTSTPAPWLGALAGEVPPGFFLWGKPKCQPHSSLQIPFSQAWDCPYGFPENKANRGKESQTSDMDSIQNNQDCPRKAEPSAHEEMESLQSIEISGESPRS